MIIEKVNRVHDLVSNWDHITNSIYQKRSFLLHLERTNNLNQRYYSLFNKGLLCAGAVVYSLKINLFTFSNFKFKLPMQVIGLPISNDESGLIGDDQYAKVLVSEIFRREKGIILCLNYTQDLYNNKVISMNSLPSMIFRIEHPNWDSYVHSLRHPYRRRILKALNKAIKVRKTKGPCSSFTKCHYEQYLGVVSRSNTKLEVMKLNFFKNLPKPFYLNSFYNGDNLLYWNITLEDGKVLYFLFGGLDYALRKVYDSYTNNLIEIVKDGIIGKFDDINLGQTAEISKTRFGAYQVKNQMFLYHKNRLIRLLFRAFKEQLSYTSNNINYRVYHENHTSLTEPIENQVHYAGIS